MAYGLHAQTIEDSIDIVHEIHFKKLNIRLILKSSSGGSQICKQNLIYIYYAKVIPILELVVYFKKRIFCDEWVSWRTPQMSIPMHVNGCDINCAPFHKHHLRVACMHASAHNYLVVKTVLHVW
jgi:hypothetical protein